MFHSEKSAEGGEGRGAAFPWSKLHYSFLTTSSHPGTTQILLTINVNTRLQSCDLSMSQLGHNPHSIRLQSHEISTPLPLGAILLAFNINWELITIDAISMGMIHMSTIPWLNNVSCRTRSTPLQSCQLSMPLPLPLPHININAKSNKHDP